MKTITMDALVGSIEPLTDWVNEILEAADCPMKVQMQMDIAIDELVSNVCYYAYPEGAGSVTFEAEITDTPKGFRLTVEDAGIPYNPLEKEDPDVTLSAEERKIGGLGIYMVKKTMTTMEYERRGERNRLTIFKEF